MITATDWEDLRHFLEVARAGGVMAAARRLGVNHSTVYRRLDRLEARLGTQLVERGGRELRLTPAGEQLRDGARDMESAAVDAEARIVGRDQAPAGTVRLTAPDDLAQGVLLPLLAAFRDQHPRVRVELVIGNRFLDISRREADVALRPTSAPPPALVGRRVCVLRSAVYGGPAQAGGDIAALDWVAWEDGLGPPGELAWMRERVDPERIALRANSMQILAEAAAQGLGATLLPTFVGDRDRRLIRLFEPRPALETDLWLLTHPELRASARIRLLTSFLFDALRRQLGGLK